MEDLELGLSQINALTTKRPQNRLQHFPKPIAKPLKFVPHALKLQIKTTNDANKCEFS